MRYYMNMTQEKKMKNQLTITEQRIFDRIQSRGHYSAVSSQGLGPEGGHRKDGGREFDACRKLVSKRLAVQIGDIYYHTITKAGYSEHCSEISIGKIS
jgi:hypothetical protein